MTPPAPVDLIIEARWIIPVEPAGLILEHHSVVIHDGQILALLPAEQARQQYAASQIQSLNEHILIPGLVNAHTHAAMNLLRGLGTDLPLMRWLNEAIWPAEREQVSERFVHDGTLLAAAEMLRGGITTCCDMYFFPDAAAAAFNQAGMRACIGMTALEFPSPYAADAADYLRKGLAARDNWKDDPLTSFVLAPHAPYTVSDASFEYIAALAEELDCGINIHLHETADEIADSLASHGQRPLARLERLGLVGPRLHATHAVHMQPEEIALLAERNVSVSHNPASNMKLASGIAPIAAMLAAGVNVALGTDGAASNNRLDIFQAMREAALLAKVSTGNAAALPAHQVLRMATLNGACALGLEARIGSIEPGKAADLCAVALDSVLHTPCHDPIGHLAYVGGREGVSHVWVAGKLRVDAARLCSLEEADLLRISRLWQNRQAR